MANEELLKQGKADKYGDELVMEFFENYYKNQLHDGSAMYIIVQESKGRYYVYDIEWAYDSDKALDKAIKKGIKEGYDLIELMSSLSVVAAPFKNKKEIEDFIKLNQVK